MKNKVKDTSKNPAAVELGRLGGLVGGKIRAERLTPERRKEIAKLGAAARWGLVYQGKGTTPEI